MSWKIKLVFRGILIKIAADEQLQIVIYVRALIQPWGKDVFRNEDWFFVRVTDKGKVLLVVSIDGHIVRWIEVQVQCSVGGKNHNWETDFLSLVKFGLDASRDDVSFRLQEWVVSEVLVVILRWKGISVVIDHQEQLLLGTMQINSC